MLYTLTNMRKNFKISNLTKTYLLLLVVLSLVGPKIAFADPVFFDQGMISLSFDDDLQSVYDNAIPLLNAAGFKSTQYVNSGPMIGATLGGGVFYTEFMPIAEVLSLHNAGHEIAAHTRSHIDLTLATTTLQRQFEIDGSRLDLLQNIGIPANEFAYPFGTSNTVTKDALKAAGFVGARGVDGSQLNTKTTDRYNLFASQVNSNTTLGQVTSWIDNATSTKEWLILVFHKVDPACTAAGVPDATEPTGFDTYCVGTTTLSQIIDYLHINNVPVKTVSEGLTLMDNPSNSGPVSDGLAPVVTAPNITAVATSASGTPITLSPIVTDSDSNLPAPLGAFCTIPNTIPDPFSGLTFPTVVTSGTLFPVGTTTVTCSATDAGGNTGTATSTVVVNPFVPANNLPVANNLTVVTNKNVATTSIVSATDADPLDTLTYSISTTTTNGILVGTLPNFTYTPNANFVGTDSFTFTANDGKGTSTPATVSITVQDVIVPPVNNVPVLDPILNPTITIGSSIAFSAHATDADATDTLTYSLVNAPAGATIDGATGAFSWTPSTTGTFTFTVSVTDGNGGTANQDVTATVNAVVVPPASGGGGGGSSSPASRSGVRNPGATTTPATAGLVLGASTSNKFIFTLTLSIGSRENEVTELQKRLTSEGAYSGPVTGYFGPLTKAGVETYQTKNNIPAVGIVGPKTREKLNAGGISLTTPAVTALNSAAILKIEQMIADLQKQLAAAIASGN